MPVHAGDHTCSCASGRRWNPQERGNCTGPSWLVGEAIRARCSVIIMRPPIKKSTPLGAPFYSYRMNWLPFHDTSGSFLPSLRHNWPARYRVDFCVRATTSLLVALLALASEGRKEPVIGLQRHPLIHSIFRPLPCMKGPLACPSRDRTSTSSSQNLPGTQPLFLRRFNSE